MKFFFLSIILIHSYDAFAYLDPATGSIIFQALVGGILAAGYFIRLYWYKIKKVLGFKVDDSIFEKKESDTIISNEEKLDEKK